MKITLLEGLNLIDRLLNSKDKKNTYVIDLSPYFVQIQNTIGNKFLYIIKVYIKLIFYTQKLLFK